MDHNISHSQNFYKYKFISPDPLYAQVKEEMRAYFASGEVDDLMFPVYLKEVLRKLGQGSFPIKETILFVDCHQARLPPDFNSVREAWLMTDILSAPVRVPGSYYQQITTVLNKPYDACNPVVNCDPCNPDITTVVVKTNTYHQQTIRLNFLLTPGNIKTKNLCNNSLNAYHTNPHDHDKFDIDNEIFSTEFARGDVYLMYYANDEDCSGNQLVPENYRIEQYILAHIKAKLYEYMWNTATADTYNQSKDRYLTYQAKADEAYVIAFTETKKQTMYQKAYGIFRDTHRNNIYERVMHGSYNRRGYPHRRW